MIFSEQALKKYLTKFSKLRRADTPYGKAPHQPVFLLTIIEEIEKGDISNNEIKITPEIVALFKENFALLCNQGHNANFFLPFNHLDKTFWHIQPNFWYKINAAIRGFKGLQEVVDYGYFENDLFDLLIQSVSRDALKECLINTYFPDKKNAFVKIKYGGGGYLANLEKYLLNESKENPTALLMDEEEEKFVRGGLFKKLVPQVYNSTCSFSGMRLISSFGFSMIDACHIIPFSVAKNDKVSNGIALCPNLHRAFDRGLLAVDNEFKIVVSTQFAEDVTNNYSLKTLENKPIQFPFGKVHNPLKENFEWHRNNVFRK
jgi:putative restriction endonuclease